MVSPGAMLESRATVILHVGISWPSGGGDGHPVDLHTDLRSPEIAGRIEATGDLLMDVFVRRPNRVGGQAA